MTATIVIGSDDLLVIMSNADFRTLAGGRVRKYRGQLWEREAERSIYDPETGEYSSRFSYILSIARRTPGPTIGATHGVIRAGERVR